MPNPGTVAVKNSRYYFAYSFDQYLHQDVTNPDEGVGIFGQIGVSDGNPNTTHWSMLIGLGGKGLVPGRPNDNWGVGYYYDGISKYIKDALAPAVTLTNEQGVELFYNFALTHGSCWGRTCRPSSLDSPAARPWFRVFAP